VIKLYELVDFLNRYLDIDKFEEIDPIVNGLEIEGEYTVSKVATCVSITNNIIDEAIRGGINVLITHHGIITRRNGVKRIVGSFKEKLRKILMNNISVLAYHLPLDAHVEIGNNVSIAKVLNLNIIDWIYEKNIPIGVVALCNDKASIYDVYKEVKSKINEKAILLKYGLDRVERIAIISGAGAKFIKKFTKREVDLFMTGEFREDCEVYAIDEKINVIVMGHYASEVFGVRNLARLLREKFNIETVFLRSEQII